MAKLKRENVCYFNSTTWSCAKSTYRFKYSLEFNKDTSLCVLLLGVFTVTEKNI